jgi:C-terminal processing protease CtpA/Prc
VVKTDAALLAQLGVGAEVGLQLGAGAVEQVVEAVFDGPDAVGGVVEAGDEVAAIGGDAIEGLNKPSANLTGELRQQITLEVPEAGNAVGGIC